LIDVHILYANATFVSRDGEGRR
jgi:hypothetical protein